MTADNGQIYGRTPKPRLLVLLFSLIPGAGHMYLGLTQRGLQIMLFFFGTLYISSLVEYVLGNLWAMVVAPVTWFFSFFETLQADARLRRGEMVEDKVLVAVEKLRLNRRFWGWILVVFGLFAGLNNFYHVAPEVVMAIRRLMVPVALIAAGIWLLAREMRRFKTQD